MMVEAVAAQTLAWQVAVVVALGGGAIFCVIAAWLIVADERTRARAEAAAERRFLQRQAAIAETTAIQRALEAARRRRDRYRALTARIDIDDDVDLAAIDAELAARGWRRINRRLQ